MRQLVALLKDRATSAVAIGARPSVAGDGVDITAWRSGAFTCAQATVLVDGSAAAALTAPGAGTEGVELWGYVLSQWWLIGSLHDGNQINIAGDSQGFAQVLNDLGAFERLAVAATVSAGSATAKFVPMESWSY